ncbi:TetR/AcrR family transcriptional regulator [Euzebya sp.]|uniref:TetR/AcrR family transcriptional regulator n=1 Tax=Euzebya sp. TaxID=1971409 RepID=UPI003517B63A
MRRSRVTAGVTLPREPKQERSRRKQTALMASAERLFAEPGFEHVTADDIAADAGFGTGTFYNYFTNKTQAFLMVAGRHETAIAPTLETISAELTAGSDIASVAEQIVGSVISDRRRVPWLRRTWLRLALTDPEVAEVQRRIDVEWDAALTELVDTLRDSPDVADLDLPSPAIATTLRVLVDALADEVVLVGSIRPDDAARTVAALLDGLVQDR